MKYLKLLTVGIITAVILFTVIAIQNPTVVKAALTLITRSGRDASSMRTSNSTSTPNFLNYGLGTTTLSFSSADLASVTVFMNVFASSTAVRESMRMEVFASDDGIDYFPYDWTVINPTAYYAASTTLNLASTTLPFNYVPSVTNSTTSKVWSLPLIPARFTRLVFSIASGTPGVGSGGRANGSMDLWVNVSGQSSIY